MAVVSLDGLWIFGGWIIIIADRIVVLVMRLYAAKEQGQSKSNR
jgi:hypothetical protein